MDCIAPSTKTSLALQLPVQAECRHFRQRRSIAFVSTTGAGVSTTTEADSTDVAAAMYSLLTLDMSTLLGLSATVAIAASLCA